MSKNTDILQMMASSIFDSSYLNRATYALRQKVEHENEYEKRYRMMERTYTDREQLMYKVQINNKVNAMKKLRETIESLCSQVNAIKFSDIRDEYPKCQEDDFNFQKDRICENLEELIEMTGLEKPS